VSNNQIELEDSLDGLRTIFQDVYFNTRKIMIASEQYAEISNLPLFYYLCGSLDQIYILNETNNSNQIKKILSNIRIVFYGFQDYLIHPAISNMVKKFKKNNFFEIETNKIIKNLNDNLKKINFSFHDQWDLFNLNKKRKKIIITANEYLLQAFTEFLSLLSTDFDINTNDWGYQIDQNRNPVHSQEYLRYFKKFMNEEYQLSRFVLHDIFLRKGMYYECAITDLRDCLDHIAKSLFMNEKEAIEELICGKEHVRRAAVETLQNYTIGKLDKKYETLQKKGITISALKEINKINEQICFGRYNKANKTWYEAVLFLYNALDKI
jgi:hypothetical protein